MKEPCTSKPTNSNANEVIELDGVEEEKHKSLGGGIHVAGEMERLWPVDKGDIQEEEGRIL